MKSQNNLLHPKDFSFLVGAKIGHLTIIGQPFSARIYKNEKVYYIILECNCGNICYRPFRTLYRKNKLVNATEYDSRCNKCQATVHGYSRDRLHKIWRGIKSRCNNSKHCGAKYYYNKNIKICKEWLDDFEVFKNWSYNNGYIDQDSDIAYKDKLSLDRIDPDKDYCPDNCRWITISENSKLACENKKNKIKFMENKIKYLEAVLYEFNVRYLGDEALKDRLTDCYFLENLNKEVK